MPSTLPRRLRQALMGGVLMLLVSPWVSAPAMARSQLMTMEVALKVENSCTVTEDDGRVKCRCSDHTVPRIEQRHTSVIIDSFVAPHVLLTVITW